MLAPADAAIVARDRAVPGLALVLDPEALGARLAPVRPDLGPFVACATYVRYKPGTSCLVAYRLDRPGNAPAELVFAKAYRGGDGAKLAKARGKAEGSDVVTLGSELVVVAGGAGDRDLPGARRLQGGDGDARRRLLGRLLPESPELWETAPRVLRYKPERRWVGVVERGEGNPVALVKAYRRSRLAAAAAGLRFAAPASCRSPRLLGTAPRAGALASSWVPGESLSDVLARPARPPAPLAEVGSALAALHQADPSGLASLRPGADARAARAAASLVATVLPSSGPAAAGLATSLSRQLDERPRPVGPRHGDFSSDQVVCGAGGVALVDFDDVAVGDPTADVGHFLAALVAAELDGRLAPGSASALSGELLGGYAAAGGFPRADLVAIHTSMALLCLAVEPFRLRRPGWPIRTEGLLEAALAWSSAGAVPC